MSSDPKTPTKSKRHDGTQPAHVPAHKVQHPVKPSEDGQVTRNGNMRFDG